MNTLRKSLFFRYIASVVLVAFSGFLPATPGFSQVAIIMPPPGEMIHITQPFDPPQMVGLKIDLKKPFNFGFIMDQGQKPLSDEVKKEEFNKLIKYFLVSLTMPNKDMWVNLSPYESRHIIPQVFAQTEMGRDLLAQDYILKQFTASLMYPETGLGKEFWQKVYAQAQDRFGTTAINVNNFNKVWIVADRADVYQKDDTAFLVASHLKVMLDQDYMAVEQNKGMFGNVRDAQADTGSADVRMAAELVRQIIIPAIEKEVNEGQSFAAVRQIYNAEIMATWFKKTLKQSLLGEVFADKSRIGGQKVRDPQAAEKIYDQYLIAYKQGVYDYIKKDVAPDGQVIPRKYFSGGLVPIDAATVRQITEPTINTTGLFDQWHAQDTAGRTSAINNALSNVPVNNIAPTAGGLFTSLANMPGPDRNQAMEDLARNLTNGSSALTAEDFARASTPTEVLNLVQSRPSTAGIELNASLPASAVSSVMTNVLPSINSSTTAEAFFNAAINPGTTEVKQWGQAAEGNASNLSLAMTSFVPATPSISEPNTVSGHALLAQQPATPLEELSAAAEMDRNTFTEAVEQTPRFTTPMTPEVVFTSFASPNPETNIEQGTAVPAPASLEAQNGALGVVITGLNNGIPSSTSTEDLANFKQQALDMKNKIALMDEDQRKNFVTQQLSTPKAVEVMQNPAAFLEVLRGVAASADEETRNLISDLVNRSTNNPEITNMFAQAVSSQAAANLVASSQATKPEVESMLSTLQQNAVAQLDNQIKGLPEVSTLGPRYAADRDLQRAAMQPAGSSPNIRESIGNLLGNLNGIDRGEAINTIMALGQAHQAIQATLERQLPTIPEIRDMPSVIPQLVQAMSLNAMKTVSNNIGGISLSDEQLTMNIKVDGAGMPLPPQFQNKAMLNLSGLTSVINAIEPLTQENVPALYKLLQ